MDNKLSVVGMRVPLREGHTKVTGSLKFTPDLGAVGALWMKILRSPHPHARIKKIDTTKADALAEVRAILTHENVPEKEIVCDLRNFVGRILDNRVRYVGDEVAAIAADNENAANEALNLIEVEYEQLPAVFDIKEAMKPDAPIVKNSGNNISSNPPETGFFKSNQGCGDIEKGFAEAEVTVECASETQSVYVGFCPPACIANWEGDKLTLTVSHQGPFDVRAYISHTLGMPLHKIRVICPQVAAAFGMLNSAHRFFLMASLLSKNTGKQVIYKMTLEEYGVYKSRETTVMKAKIGGKKDGTITALEIEQLRDNGGYAQKATPVASMHDIFPRANVKYYGAGVSTNKLSTGDVRGVGDVTEALVINQAVDMLAEKIGADPITIWKKNHIKEGELRFSFGSGVTLSGEAIDELLDKGSSAIRWEEKWKGWAKPYQVTDTKKRAVGMSVGLHLSGIWFVPVISTIRVHHDGTANVSIAYMELGTGCKTTLAQIAAEALGLKFEDVYVVRDVDTETVPFSMPSGGSSSLHVGGSVVKVAALDAKRQILELAISVPWAPECLKDGVNTADDLDIKDSYIYVKADPERRASIGAIIVPLQTSLVIGRANKQDLPFSPAAYQFMAGFADVEVDTETGKVQILNYVACQDSGQLINPDICENQVLGGVSQSIAYALAEEIAFDPSTGKPLNPSLSDYWAPTSMDTPPLEVHFSENIDSVGPYGAKGVGEGPTICPHAAIASAIYNAIGVRIYELPITPDKVLKALGKI